MNRPKIMFSFLRSSNVVQQATKSWRQLVNQTFCCHVRPDALLNPRRDLSYATFHDDEASDDVMSSYGDHDDQVISKKDRPSSLDGLLNSTQDSPSSNSPSNVVIIQPTTPLHLSSPIKKSPTSPLLSPQVVVPCIPSATFATKKIPEKYDPLSPTSEYSSSGVSTGVLTQPSSMEFSDTLEGEQPNSLHKIEDTEENKSMSDETPVSGEANELENVAETENTISDSSHVNGFQGVSDDSILKPEPEQTSYVTSTSDELLKVVDKCPGALDVLEAVARHEGPISPLLAVACIHYIYTKALAHYERNSPEYNQLCGQIHTNQSFRSMLYTVEQNAKLLNNFALLTLASDLLYLRITLKKSTITVLLSCVEYESLNLIELRLLASCLHTPNIPMVNSEYVYNVAGSVAMKYLHEITDLYTLLSVMKCLGRYFTTQAKRQADSLVANFVKELPEKYPDGRLMASHMFDAFYRMEHATSKSLQIEACKAINSSTIPLLPQDVSAILRYLVKYGYNLEKDGFAMLSKIGGVLLRNLESGPVSKLTTNVKWLSVFYFYNEDLYEKYVTAVKRDMDKLDFVALSDVIDTLAQVYYLPKDADTFFDMLHEEMMKKYPTLQHSNVKNVLRKVLLTAFHFSVFGRYPEALVKLTLSPAQIELNRGASKFFLREFCESVRIERPDLLPPSLPPFNDQSFNSPKLYAFEKDVRSVLNAVVGPRKFMHASSPVRGLPMFILRQQLNGQLLPINRNSPGFIPPHFQQTIQNVAVIPLPRSRYCISSKHAVGKTRHALRLIRAQGARVVTVPHFDWDGHSFDHKSMLLSKKIFEQRYDDVIE